MKVNYKQRKIKHYKYMMVFNIKIANSQVPIPITSIVVFEKPYRDIQDTINGTDGLKQLLHEDNLDIEAIVLVNYQLLKAW